jgi:hypothetical protein
MNQIPSIIKKYGKLNCLGKEILEYNKHLVNIQKYDILWKTDEIRDQQEKRVEEFFNIATSVSEDWEKHQNDLNKYWTGLS